MSSLPLSALPARYLSKRIRASFPICRSGWFCGPRREISDRPLNGLSWSGSYVMGVLPKRAPLSFSELRAITLIWPFPSM
jgi:hypothetical protein